MATQPSEQTSQNFGCPASFHRLAKLSPTSPRLPSRFLPKSHPRLPLPLDALPHSLGVRHLLTCSVSHPTLIAQPPPWVCFGPRAPPGFAQSLTSPSLYIAFPFAAISLLLSTPLRRVSLRIDATHAPPHSPEPNRILSR